MQEINKIDSTNFLRNIAFEGKQIAKKSFGQNFLINENIIEKITQSFDCNPTINPDANIIEIGTGLGSLTFFLLKRTEKFTGIEKDSDLNQRMVELFSKDGSDYPHFINEDALKFDFKPIVNRGTVIVSNLPYNVGTKILLHLGTTCLQEISAMVVMLQKDVIEKITIKHSKNGKNNGYHQLGAFFQTFCMIEEVCNVPPSAFSPAPNVLSAVVKITPIIQIKNIQEYWAFLHKAFSYNRKMLSTIFEGKVSEQFSKKRPSELTPNELLEVWKTLMN